MGCFQFRYQNLVRSVLMQLFESALSKLCVTCTKRLCSTNNQNDSDFVASVIPVMGCTYVCIISILTSIPFGYCWLRAGELTTYLKLRGIFAVISLNDDTSNFNMYVFRHAFLPFFQSNVVGYLLVKKEFDRTEGSLVCSGLKRVDQSCLFLTFLKIAIWQDNYQTC